MSLCIAPTGCLRVCALARGEWAPSCVPGTHSVRLAGARLAVRKHSGVVPLQKTVHHVRHAVKQLLLASGGRQHAVKVEGAHPPAHRDKDTLVRALDGVRGVAEPQVRYGRGPNAQQHAHGRHIRLLRLWLHCRWRSQCFHGLVRRPRTEPIGHRRIVLIRHRRWRHPLARRPNLRRVRGRSELSGSNVSIEDGRTASVSREARNRS